MFMAPQIVTVKGSLDQGVTKKCSKIEPDGGKSEMAAQASVGSAILTH